MADESSTAVLRYPGGEHEMAIRAATEGASAIDIGKLLPDTGHDHPRLRLRQHRGVRLGDHLHRR